MELKIGDEVQLKSGGPVMTIEEIGTYSDVVKAKCTWFDDKKKCTDLFVLATLEIFE